MSERKQEKAEAVHRRHLEEGEQIALFEWLHWMSGTYPELDLLFHIPNGGKRNNESQEPFPKGKGSFCCIRNL